ncbi:MAG: ABC transporter substrate-binding protein [Campylobacterota bacterium]|nr:ABC transporter substrate-binding protein [Campylobacterota bacterium]
MKQFIAYLLILTFTLFAPLSLSAAQTEEEELKTMMIEKSEIFYSILRDKSSDTETREQKVLDEVSPLFDFNLMARLSLNKKIWKSISKEQRKQFSDIFVARIKRSYLNKMDIFADTEVLIQASTRVKKNRIQVTASLKTKTDTKEIIYKFYLTKKREWLIYDVEVVGVSFLQSYRSQYASFLKEHSFDELLKKLENDDEKPA